MDKKNILKITIITLLLTILLTPTINAWDDCPFGLENEPYPGTCPRYTDTNNDGICDHSQPKPTTENENQNTEAQTKSQQQTKTNNNTKFPIMIIISLIVVLTFIVLLKYLVKKQTISSTQEKIIWNILLLIFFLPSAITGLTLLISTNMGILREIGLNFLQIHDITSLFFMWITAYHIIWHTGYYRKCSKKLLSKEK